MPRGDPTDVVSPIELETSPRVLTRSDHQLVTVRAARVRDSRRGASRRVR